jgi:hypothetical protein
MFHFFFSTKYIYIINTKPASSCFPKPQTSSQREKKKKRKLKKEDEEGRR